MKSVTSICCSAGLVEETTSWPWRKAESPRPLTTSLVMWLPAATFCWRLRALAQVIAPCDQPLLVNPYTCACEAAFVVRVEPYTDSTASCTLGKWIDGR